jgi:deazaflavin-dependent oxidoreductase (nitroreductase family)
MKGTKLGQENSGSGHRIRVHHHHHWKMLIVGSYAGAPKDPAWVHNLRANPKAHIEVGTDEYDVDVRELPSDEREDLYAKVAAAAPGFGEYQPKTSRVIPHPGLGDFGVI